MCRVGRGRQATGSGAEGRGGDGSDGGSGGEVHTARRREEDGEVVQDGDDLRAGAGGDMELACGPRRHLCDTPVSEQNIHFAEYCSCTG